MRAPPRSRVYWRNIYDVSAGACNVYILIRSCTLNESTDLFVVPTSFDSYDDTDDFIRSSKCSGLCSVSCGYYLAFGCRDKRNGIGQ